MSLRRRGNTWWIDFTTPSGERIRCSARTSSKTQAQELHDKLKADAWRQCSLGEKPRRSWNEAAYKWLTETQDKRTHEEDKAKIRWLQHFLRGRYLDEIDRELIATIGARKAEEASPATANRMMALVRAILRKACFEWEWLVKVPKVRLYPEPKRRVRWITPEQAQRLLAELPEHQRDMALFALATGLRQANVVKLEWPQVDLERGVAWIYADQAKAEVDIHVPLNATAMGVLQRQRGKHPTRVFTYKGKPIRSSPNNTSWKKALKRAGLEDFRWHDLRHTWASWHTQNGTPLYVLQALGAWGSDAMVKRYAHLSPAYLASHAAVVDKVLNGTNSAHAEDEKEVSELLTT